jgi:hypothetical protein
MKLDREWQDDEFKIQLPAMPRLSHVNMPVRREILRGLKALAENGCEEPALCWCLEMLLPDREEERKGTQYVRNVTDDTPLVDRVIPRAMATREDMATLSRTLSNAMSQIQKRRKELLLVAEACADMIPLPSGVISELELAEDALPFLMSSLAWAKSLADFWESPNEAAYMKGKGLLYITVYVWFATADKDSGPSSDRRHRIPVHHRLPTRTAQGLVELISAYAGIDTDAQSLNEKLQDFAAKEREAFSRMLALVQKLHSTAQRSAKLRPRRSSHP